MTDPVSFIKQHIGRHSHLALGTIDGNGAPWVVTVGLSYDDEMNIFWLSRKDTEHSKYIAERPLVSCCVFSKQPDVGDFGFYSQGHAREVTNPDELSRLLQIRFRNKGKSTPSIDNFMGNAPDRIYIAELTAAWATDDEHIKTAVDLEELHGN